MIRPDRSALVRWQLLLLLLPVLLWPVVQSWTVRTTARTVRPTTASRLFSRGLFPHRNQPTAVCSTTITTTTLEGVEIRGPLTCLSNHLVVKVRDTLTATGGGILLPDQSQTRPTEGTVVAATGPGRCDPYSGALIPNPIAPGMSVVYGKFDGKPVEYNGEECQIIRDDNVLLVYTGVTMRLDTVQLIRDYVLIALFDNDSDNDSTDSDNTSNTNASNNNLIATSSGVVIAASVLKDALPCQGRVVKVGPGRWVTGNDSGGSSDDDDHEDPTTTTTTTMTTTRSPVQPGDSVKFKEYAGNDIRIEGKPYTVVKMVDLLSTYRD